MSEEKQYMLIEVADGAYPTEGDLKKLLSLTSPESPECGQAFLELTRAFNEDSAVLNHAGVFHILLDNSILLKVVDVINSDADTSVKDAAAELMASVVCEGFKPSKSGDSSPSSIADLLMIAAISPNDAIAKAAVQAVIKFVNHGEKEMRTLATTLVILAAPSIIVLPNPETLEELLPLIRKKIHLLNCLSALIRAHVEFHNVGECVDAATKLLDEEHSKHTDTPTDEENNAWEDLFEACYVFIERATRTGFCSRTDPDDERYQFIERIARLTTANEDLLKQNEEMKLEIARLRALIEAAEKYGPKTRLQDVHYEFLPNTHCVVEENTVRNTDNKYTDETFLIGERMSTGIHRLTFKIPDISSVYLGVCDSEKGLPRRGVRISKVGHGTDDDLRYGQISNTNNSTIGRVVPVQKDDTVSMEIDLVSEDPSKRTLRYFINGKPQTVMVVGLPPLVQFASTLGAGRSILFESFADLTSPSPSNNEREIVWDHGDKEQVAEKEDVPVKEAVNDLSELELHYSDPAKIKVQDNYIIREGEKSYETCFIAKELTNGVYRLTFKISSELIKTDFLYCGVIDAAKGYPPQKQDISGSQTGIQYRLSGGTLWDQTNRSVGADKAAKENDVVSLVLDLRNPEPENRTLHFFVNKVQFKYYFFALPEAVQIGFCVYGASRPVEFMSFEELEDSPVLPKTDSVPHPFGGDVH